MSFDPFAAGSEPPSEYGPTAPLSTDRAAIRQRVQAPAIALIVLGILNLLWVGWIFFNVAVTTLTPAEQFHKQISDIYQSFPQLQGEMNKRSPEEIKNQAMFFGWGMAAFSLVNTVVTIVGGARMLALKNYGLAICGAICAALPCISCLGCCGVGQGIALWAIIVLLNADIRSAFP